MIPIHSIGYIISSPLNPLLPQKQSTDATDWISLSEAAKFSPYGMEYLSLLARKGRLGAKKINGVWHTTRPILEQYLERQLKRAELQEKNTDTYRPFVGTNVSSGPIIPAPVLPPVVGPSASEEITGEVPVENVREDVVTNRTSEVVSETAVLNAFLDKLGHHIDHRIEANQGFLTRTFHFVKRAYKHVFSSKKLVVLSAVLIIVLVIAPVRFVSGFAENFFRGAVEVVKDAQTVMGFRPGTHENEQ